MNAITGETEAILDRQGAEDQFASRRYERT